MNDVNRHWCVAARPVGPVKESDFVLRRSPIPEPGDGEFLIRTHFLSVAPVMRNYMLEAAAGEKKALDIGDTMIGRGVGTILKSNNPHWQVGDIVQGRLCWQDYAIATGAPDTLMFKIKQRVAPISTGLGVLGMTGWTSYCSLKDIGQPKPGETLVVSGAMGGVGSIAVQVGRLMGCKVIGIAGSKDKCAVLTEKLGCDAAINYQTEDISEALEALAPEGVDIFFDNVGGPILDSVITHINKYARLISCGRISEYLKGEPYALKNWGHIAHMCARLEGFFVYNYADMFEEAEQVMADWIATGDLKYQEDILTGLEQMPQALIRLYEGKNRGKQLVHVSNPA